MFQKDIEREFSIRSSTATGVLKQLEQNRLIRRAAVPYDNRLRKIVPTGQAKLHGEEVARQFGELELALVRGIPQDKLEVYFEVAEKMIENLQE